MCGTHRRNSEGSEEEVAIGPLAFDGRHVTLDSFPPGGRNSRGHNHGENSPLLSCIDAWGADLMDLGRDTEVRTGGGLERTNDPLAFFVTEFNMKIICRPNKVELRNQAREHGNYSTRLWKKSLPFNVNPRGILIHRVRSAVTIFVDGGRSHDAVHYWCGNQACGDGVGLVAIPPLDRLLCSRCEALAVAAGEPTAETLAGRHVCTGELKAVRLCCRNEQN